MEWLNGGRGFLLLTSFEGCLLPVVRIESNAFKDDLKPGPVLSHSMPEFHSGAQAAFHSMTATMEWFHPQSGGLEQDEKSGGRAGMRCPAWNAYGLKDQPCLRDEVVSM
ncbi:hypothetical protein [Siphonobacter sp.]|uniref:hypothetical protein n=1 Tax=Siphonobacter sp. TaxID=1869184 RepID=UPI003B3BAC16